MKDAIIQPVEHDYDKDTEKKLKTE